LSTKNANQFGSGLRTIRVAGAQYPIDKPADRFAWRDKLETWIADGAATGAELLVFPEYGAIEQAATFGAEVYTNLEQTLYAVAEAAGERLAMIAELAAAHGVHILAPSGPVRRNNGAVVNAAQLITPLGAVGEQEKIIITPFERDWGVSGGTTIRVFDTSLGRIGIAICYDSEFPLLVRAMAVAGADVLLVPSCTEKVSGFHRVRTGARARALENQMAAITSPTIKEASWSPAVDINTGAAGIYVPPEHGVSDDGIMAEGDINEPGWIVADIDLAALHAVRTSGEMRNARDWAEQPGANTLQFNVDSVKL